MTLELMADCTNCEEVVIINSSDSPEEARYGIFCDDCNAVLKTYAKRCEALLMNVLQHAERGRRPPKDLIATIDDHFMRLFPISDQELKRLEKASVKGRKRKRSP